ncbi:MAG: dTMP kinase [Gemmatimonadaceae bacterium]
MPLIVLEGPEGAGKTTQLRLLAEWLTAAGNPVVAFREPGGTVVGDEIRKILLDHPGSDIVPRAESLLFMASRAQLIERGVAPALASGATVLLDRFFLSTYAYQVAGRGLPHEQVGAANRLATAELRPDVTLLLSLPVEQGLARVTRRGAHDRIEQAEGEFHERVAQAFAEFATKEWQGAHPEAGPVVTIDARGTVEDVFSRVLAALEKRWPGTSPRSVARG